MACPCRGILPGCRSCPHTRTLPASSLLSCLHGFCSLKEKKLIHRARMDLFCRKKKEKKRKKLMVWECCVSQEKLWEKVDPQWLACLQAATVKDWLLLPSGIAQVYIHLYGSLFCLSVCPSFASFFFVKAWEVRDCCSFSFAMVIIVASVWKTLPKSCMHREGSVQQWDELQRHRDEEEDAPWELDWGYCIRVTVMFLSFF